MLSYQKLREQVDVQVMKLDDEGRGPTRNKYAGKRRKDEMSLENLSTLEQVTNTCSTNTY
jgi:hypothetical protein